MFIAGTDTNVGKTFVISLIYKYFKCVGLSVITQKWIQTGSTTPIDLFAHKTDIFFQESCPYIFKFAFSPHLAAKLEDKFIDKNKIIESYYFLKSKFEYVIVEGSGGVLVPYFENNLMIDIVKELDIDVVLVVGNKLGAINHTLLSIEALQNRNIKIKGLIFNNLDENRMILDDNIEIISKISNLKILGILDKIEDVNNFDMNKFSIVDFI